MIGGVLVGLGFGFQEKVLVASFVRFWEQTTVTRLPDLGCLHLASWLTIPEYRAVDISFTRMEQLAHCMSIKEADPAEELPSYHDIKVFLESGSLPPYTSVADRKTLARLASTYVIGAGHLYRRSYN